MKEFNGIDKYIGESNEDTLKAREFCREVKELNENYGMSYFFVTEGASVTDNRGCDAVRNARDAHVKWEMENDVDSKHDWSE